MGGGRSNPSATSPCGSLLLSASAYARSSDDVIAFEGHYDAFSIIRDMRDRLGRTALHTAAIMDRDSATKALLALGSNPATRDVFHDLCLQEMILNMPSIVRAFYF